MPATIRAPDSPALAELARQLSALADELDESAEWPARQLALCAEFGVYEWFVPREYGGQAWNDADIVRGYLALAKACLTTTFIVTQRTAACQRIAASSNDLAKAHLLPRLATTDAFATVAISHLSTSRRHLGAPVLVARAGSDGFELNGYSAWVTGADHAQTLVVGATLDDGREIIAAIPTTDPGVTIEPPARLVGLSASHTGAIRLQRVVVRSEQLLLGPVVNVMRVGSSGTGGLQTSTLAVGLADAAIELVEIEAQRRANLQRPAAELRDEWSALHRDLLSAATSASCSAEQLRLRANSLVLRATQAALVAAKGTGYVVGHRAGRWCREALFFLVWSCPQPVTDAHLCELAGLGDVDDD